MKKIVIHTQKGVSDSLAAAAQEAVEEFVSVFPEYRNSFTIELLKDEDIRDFRHSLEKMIKESSKKTSDGGIDADKLLDFQNENITRHGGNDIIVSLVKDPFHVSCPDITTYGITKGSSVVVSTDSCGFNKDFMETIVIHELGHVFQATHNGRSNTVFSEEKGVHCTNDLCIMGDDNYPKLNKERLRRKKEKTPLYPEGRPPFCDDCIASMREYMSHMPELVKEVNVQPREPVAQEQQRIISTVPQMPDVPMETLPVLPHNDRSWKKDLRTFYKQVANDHDYEYKEELSAQNYLVRMKRQDGSVLDIEANNEYNIALGAKDAEGNSDIPSVEDMQDLVKYAQSKGSSMNFGKNNEPEFNARLMIACLEAKLRMRHAPKIDETFLAQINPKTRERLQKLLNPEEKEEIRPTSTKTMIIGESR